MIGAGAAQGSLAADVGAGKVERVAQVMDQQRAGFNFTVMRNAVHRYIDLLGHGKPREQQLGIAGRG